MRPLGTWEQPVIYNLGLFATAHCLSGSQLTLIRRLERKSDEGKKLLNCGHWSRSMAKKQFLNEEYLDLRYK